MTAMAGRWQDARRGHLFKEYPMSGECTIGVWIGQPLWEQVSQLFVDEDTGEFCLEFQDYGKATIRCPSVEILQQCIDQIEERIRQDAK